MTPEARAHAAAVAATDQEVAAALLGAKRAIVCAHVTPDGDAVGSVLALTMALRRAGVDATATLADHHHAPSTYAFLEGFDLYRASSGVEPADVFVALDTPNLRRLGVSERLAQAADTLVVIDHHADCADFGTMHLVDTGSASTTSLVWRLLPTLGVEPDAAMAAACYAGLITDTGRFSYANTTPLALRNAAEMIEAGADARHIFTRIYESRSAASLALLGRVLARVTLANNGRVAYSWMSDSDLAETGALPEDTENIVDVVRQIGRVDAVVFFKAQPDAVKIALRSKCPTLDVAAIAHRFGGGGHKAAAGAAAPLPLESAIEAVLAQLPGAGR